MGWGQPHGQVTSVAPAGAVVLASQRARALLSLGGSSQWRVAEDGADGQKYLDDRRQLSLIWSIARYDDHAWLHVSLASPRRMPTWEEFVEVKEALIGRDVEAYQVLPPRSRWVNQHPNCLHLFALAEGDGDRAVLPDFSFGGQSI